MDLISPSMTTLLPFFDLYKIFQNEEPLSPNPPCTSPISSEVISWSPQASNDKDSLIGTEKLLSEEDKSDEIQVKEQLYNYEGINLKMFLRKHFLSESPEKKDITEYEEVFDFEEARSKYRAIEKIGEGTFSSVYKAVSLTTHETVVLKRISPTCSPDRILNEIKYLHLLGGKANVLSLLGALRYKDQVSLVLPFVEHQKFKDYLPLMSVENIRSYMKALFIALEHVHAHKIIHRDVKPGNFLYNPDSNTYVLVDFGLAQSADVALETLGKRTNTTFVVTPVTNCILKRKREDSTEQCPSSKRKYSRYNPPTVVNKVVPVQSIIVKKPLRAPRGGTRGFRAPEVLLKCHNQTVAIDIWSAGVILLCLLSTRYPFFTAPDDLISLVEIAALFGTQELREVARKLNRIIRFPCDPQDIPKTPLMEICNKLTSRTEKIPYNAFDLLERCLDLNPSTRITAKEALKHPFFQN